MGVLNPEEIAAAGGQLGYRTNVWATAGDSLIGKGIDVVYTGASQKKDLMCSGPQFWAQLASKAKVRFPVDKCYAVGGTTTADLVNTQLPQVLASGCAGVLVVTTTNDPPNSITPEQSISNLTTFILACSNAGIIVALCATTPCGSSSNTAARRTAAQLAGMNQVRRWLLTDAPKLAQRVHVYDPFPTVSDRSSTLGDYINTMTYDGIHPKTLGCYNIALPIVPILNLYYPEATVLVGSNSELYDATYNPQGSLLANSCMTGTTAATGTGWSGNVPSPSWSQTRTNSTTMTAVGSKVSTATGDWFQVVVGGTTDATSSPTVSVYQNATLANLAAGDIFYALAEIEVDAGTTDINAIDIALSKTAATGVTFDVRRCGSTTSLHGQWPTAAVSGVLVTDAMQYVGNETSVRLTFEVLGKESGSPAATIRIRNVSIHKVRP